ncbi:Hypothetical predicted protein [Olea europaea subsp. europaea]|uniref:Uncharacterized protein n=1 Tax=Olea europaea subsp. europaea TaxID=158383 RepID=A0A8S0T6V6_OLEEU|nr:Hypothetical predicted protein [Olea europaea subsp. europaea]
MCHHVAQWCDCSPPWWWNDGGVDGGDSDNCVTWNVTSDNENWWRNVTEGIELGCDGGATEQDEDDYAGTEHNEDQEADDLECPSFEELLSTISSDDEFRNGYAGSTLSD